MPTPHKHAELIKAWADGAKIEQLGSDGEWCSCLHPFWGDKSTYRVAPKGKVKKYLWVLKRSGRNLASLNFCQGSSTEAVTVTGNHYTEKEVEEFFKNSWEIVVRLDESMIEVDEED